MENTIVAAALLVVILLLAIVVYDTNPILRNLFSRSAGKASHQKKRASDEEDLDEIMDEADPLNHEISGFPIDEVETIDQDITAAFLDGTVVPDEEKKPGGMAGRLKGIISRNKAPDEEALEAFHLLCQLEGIIPALESAHAVAEAVKLAPEMDASEVIVVNLSGRGDKDLATVNQMEGKAS